MFQAYSAIFTTLDTLRHIHPNSGIFQHSFESWHSQTYSCILRHIQNTRLIQEYSEPLTYLACFRHYSRAIHAYSEAFLSRFRHIQNYGLFRYVMFHRYFRQINKVTHIEAYLPTLEFRYIQDPGITGSSNVKQHMLVNSGSSFKSLFRSIWNLFSFLF